MKNLLFGTGGIPMSAKGRSVPEGIKKIRELGLGAMELEFVHGVWLKDAGPVKSAQKETGVVLTAHGPYYINLASKKPATAKASIERIYDTAKMCFLSGGYSVTFHSAYYQDLGKEKTYSIVRQALKTIIKKLEDNSIKIWVRPESGGKKSQFGDLDELIKISQDVEMVLPCIDFSHMHARNDGKFNSYEEWVSVFQRMEKGLGKEALKNMHCHFSGINYNEKGERNHLNLKDSDFDYRALAKALKDFGINGAMICESPNLEEDAQLLQKTYSSF
jgi:deoxyribonuclease-4